MLEVAKGPWDEWYYLKYFDSEDPKEDFCRETGTRTNEGNSQSVDIENALTPQS